MKLLEDLRLELDNPLWAKFPQLAVYDTILENNIDIFKIFEEDITKDLKNNNKGRKDIPSVEQIIRAIVYKQLRSISYEELEIHQFDSEICKRFLKLNHKAFSDSTYQNYTKKIKPENIQVMYEEINKIAIEMGYEDGKDIRTDSTKIESDIQHPTNNSLVFDCIKTATGLLKKILDENSKEYKELIDRYIEDKIIYYELNNIKMDPAEREDRKQKRAEKMKSLFERHLALLEKISEEIKTVIKNELSQYSQKDSNRIQELSKQIDIIYKSAYRFQIEGKKVENSDKLFSIYESHTDIIVKGLRECFFGHKVNISSGKSNLILYCKVLEGNPGDTTQFEDPLQTIKNTYNVEIESIAHDGGYASLKNQEFASKVLKIKNIVFTKIIGSLQNIVESEAKEKILTNFRAGAEAVISNLKRGFDLQRVNWKGFEMFKAKVYWGVVGYNIRVLTSHILGTLFPKPIKG